MSSAAEDPARPFRTHTHSRVINDVRYIWDVYKLWELAKDLPVISVEVASFKELDLDCWFCGKKAPTIRRVADHCRRIAKADLEVPIILDADGSLMDGGHRLAKALMLGNTTIKAVRFPVQPPPERTEPIQS